MNVTTDIAKLDDRKRDEQVKVMLTSRELAELHLVANAQHRKLSDYVHLIIRLHLRGHCPTSEPLCEGHE